MSNAFGAEQWLHLFEDYIRVLALDVGLQQYGPKPEDQASRQLQLLYFRYRYLIQRLTEYHNAMVQPQVRATAGKLLELAIVRMLELRREVAALCLREFGFPDTMNILIELKLGPADVELRTPWFDSGKRLAQLQKLDEILGSSTEVADPTDSAKTRELAILMLQSHERARIARKTFIEKQTMQARIARGIDNNDPSPAEKLAEDRAALCIQKFWRGYLGRRVAKAKQLLFDRVVGLKLPEPRSSDDDEKSRYLSRVDELQLRQFEAFQKLQEQEDNIKQKLWRSRGGDLTEDIEDELRNWYIDWFEKLGHTDVLPEEKLGGSVLVALGITRTPEEYIEQQNQTKGDEDEQAKGKGLPAAPQDDPSTYRMKNSSVFLDLLRAVELANEEWTGLAHRIQEPGLFEEPLVLEVSYRLQFAARRVADRVIREELNELKLAIRKDHADDDDPFEFPKPESFPEEVLPTFAIPHDELEDLSANSEDVSSIGAETDYKVDPGNLLNMTLKLLHEQDVFRRDYPRHRLSDWPASSSFATRSSVVGKLGDVRSAIMDYCILPMSSVEIHRQVPLIRSVALCGLADADQSFLGYAICNELRAPIFDLTARRHADKFRSNQSLTKLARDVLSAAKALAPAIVLLEDEEPWLKRMPYSATRMASICKSIVTGIKPGDRVLLLTLSTKPHETTKVFKVLHDKLITLPFADTSSALQGLQCSSVVINQGVERLASVAKAAEGLPIGLLRSGLTELGKLRKRLGYRVEPLNATIIAKETLRSDLVDKQLKAYDRFEAAQPLEKKRRAKIRREAEEAAKIAKLAAKKKK